MIRRPIWFLALAMVWAVAPSFAHAQDGGSIVGEVVDQATLEPIVGATITVVSHELSDLTNEDGHFSLRGVPAGSISVRVERLGYIAVVGEVEVRSNSVSFVRLPLAPMAFLLDELRVVADRSEVEVESGGSYTEIIPDESDSARNALELLTTRVPSLTVRTGRHRGRHAERDTYSWQRLRLAKQHAFDLHRWGESRYRVPGRSLRYRGTENPRTAGDRPLRRSTRMRPTASSWSRHGGRVTEDRVGADPRPLELSHRSEISGDRLLASRRRLNSATSPSNSSSTCERYSTTSWLSSRCTSPAWSVGGKSPFMRAPPR